MKLQERINQLVNDLATGKEVFTFKERPSSQLRPGTRKLHIKTGQEFGGWTVLGPAASIASGTAHRTAYLCRCKCGTECPVRATSLLAGKSRSCNSPKCFVRNARIGGASVGRKRKKKPKKDISILTQSWKE